MALPGNYYLDPLEHIIAWVRRHHAALVDARLAGYLAALERLPLAARRLFVRLLLRRGPDFRIDLLDYPEVGDNARAALALAVGGFARLRREPTHRLVLLRVPELRALLAACGLCHAAGERRSELLDRCAALPEAQLAPRLPAVIELHAGDGIDLLRLLYFGSLRQDLTEFILADIGTLRWQPVPLRPSLPWRNANELRESLAVQRTCDLVRDLAALAERLDDVELDGLADALRSLPADRHTRARRNKALLRLADLQAHSGSARRQVSLLRRVTTAPGRERLCRLLAGCGRRAGARRVLEAMSAAPADAGEAHFAAAFDVDAGRCRPRRRRGLRIDRWRLPQVPDLRVEDQVADAFSRGGARALHMENRLPGMLFALGFWDIIYRPLAGAFVQPFQSGPLDLFEPDFHRRRADAIEARLAQIGDGRYGVECFLDVVRRHGGTVNPFWYWWPWEVRAARAVLASLPPHARRVICARVARNPVLARAGFPDLTVIGGAPDCYEFVEVKGPGDQLRDGQRDWLEHLRHAGLRARVLEVRWA